MVAGNIHPAQGQTRRYHDPRGPIALKPASKALGVTAGHLSRVLRGERTSKALSARYAALVAQVQTQAPTPLSDVN
jgi:hypothetical protein